MQKFWLPALLIISVIVVSGCVNPIVPQPTDCSCTRDLAEMCNPETGENWTGSSKCSGNCAEDVLDASDYAEQGWIRIYLISDTYCNTKTNEKKRFTVSVPVIGPDGDAGKCLTPEFQELKEEGWVDCDKVSNECKDLTREECESSDSCEPIYGPSSTDPDTGISTGDINYKQCVII